MNRKLNGLVILVEFVIAGGVLFWLSYIPGYDIQRWELTWDGVPDELIDKRFGRVTCLEMAPNGDIWGCTDQGLIHYDGNKWEYLATQELWHVQDLAITSDGTIWAINTNDQIIDYDAITWNTDDSIENVENLEIDSDGVVWLSTYDEYYKLNYSSWEIQPNILKGDTKTPWIGAFYVTDDGSIWLSTYSAIFHHITDNDIYTHKVDVQSGYIVRIAANADGTLWAYTAWPKATYFGLVNFNGRRWKYISPEQITFEDYVHAIPYDIDIDSAGNLWLATENGICNFDQWRCTSYFLGEETYSITVLPDESLLVGFKNGVALMKK